MENAIIFIIMMLLGLSTTLAAFYLGRAYLYGYVAASIILMNIFVVKGVYIFGIATAGGNVLYATVFLATDLLNEYWGKKEAQKAVWVGFFVTIMFLIMSQLFLRMVPADYDIAQGAMETLFGFLPRVVLGSMAAYLVSQSLDVYLFSRIKQATGEKMLWLRNNASTMVSQLADTTIFTLIVFWGVYPKLWQFILFAYVLKVIIAICDTPYMYLSKIIYKWRS
ncbi:MAG: queuosine precursor transporter [Patescibacteria group bacterium]